MLVALFAAASAAAAPAGYQPPDWLRKPTAQEFANAYPAHAARHRISGAAEIHCAVNLHGLLEQCTVVAESPPGEGFGAAALLLASTFSMRPPIGPNGPTTGSVNIPIRFVIRQGAPPPPLRASGDSNPYGGGSRLLPVTTASGEADSIIVNPVWSAAPSFAEVAAAYPAKASGASGHVVLRCRRMAAGALRACETISEYPPGKGFLAAAKSLISDFRLDAAVPGADVDVPISFVDPASTEFKQRRIGAPSWRVHLDPAKVAQVFPEEAAAKGIKTGRGVAKCAVAADGALTSCQEMPGDPDGLGFSHSAVVVASAMAMNPWTDEGGPVDGAVITLTIRFNLGADAHSGGAPASK